MKVLLENYFPPLVDLLGSYQDPLPGYCSHSFAGWVLTANIHSWPLSRELASSCLGDNFPLAHTLYTARQWLPGIGIQKAVPTLWYNSGSRTPCSIQFTLDSRLDCFLGWLLSPTVSAFFISFLLRVLTNKSLVQESPSQALCLGKPTNTPESRY